MTKDAKYVLIGVGSLFTFATGAVLMAVFLREPPDHIVRRGAFEIYEFRYESLGEPGRHRQELWYHGKRLAEHPGDMWFNADEDQVIFVNAKGAQHEAGAPKDNGIYYFDARNGKLYMLAEGEYPKLFTSEPGRDPTGAWINTNPWAMNGKVVVVSYGDSGKLPELVAREQHALIVDLDTGEVRDAAKLLHVDESEHIMFRGWSLDGSNLFFRVGSDDRALPMSVVQK